MREKEKYLVFGLPVVQAEKLLGGLSSGVVRFFFPRNLTATVTWPLYRVCMWSYFYLTMLLNCCVGKFLFIYVEMYHNFASKFLFIYAEMLSKYI